MIALPNPGGNFTCTLFMPFEGEVSLEKLNTKEAVTSFFETYFPDTLSMMPNLVDDFLNNPTGNLATMRCYPWVKNNVALMGDSAHAIVPFYGQGMNCSFEDCVVLDQCIDEFKGDWTKILDAYQKSRKPNSDAIASLALQNFIEMRDLVGSPEFLHKKHIEHDLVVLYPDKFKSQYERTTFSNENYLDALNWGAKNDALLEYIISEKLEDKVSDAQFMEQLFAKML
jgi:kynurenine 3-monooxygenase